MRKWKMAAAIAVAAALGGCSTPASTGHVDALGCMTDWDCELLYGPPDGPDTVSQAEQTAACRHIQAFHEGKRLAIAYPAGRFECPARVGNDVDPPTLITFTTRWNVIFWSTHTAEQAAQDWSEPACIAQEEAGLI